MRFAAGFVEDGVATLTAIELYWPTICQGRKLRMHEEAFTVDLLVLEER